MADGSFRCFPGSTSFSGVDCPAGHYCPGVGSAAPQPCPAGTYAPPPGAGLGYQSKEACLLCAAGRFGPAGAPNASGCAPCAIDTFSASPGTPCAPCPAGQVAPAPGATSCAAPVVGAGGGAAAGSGWAAAQAVIVPALSILGAIFTYLAVGDRLFAFCAPRAHARVWRGAASGVRSLTPALALFCCCCCRARATAALDGIAVGLLKRLADMEEERRKMALAQKAFRAPAADGGAASAPAAAAATTNPLYAAGRGGGAAALAEDAAGGAWTRHSDESDVWYSRGEEVVWALPEGAVLVGGGGGDGAEVWTRHYDGEDTWYTCGDATAWEPPEGARVVDSG